MERLLLQETGAPGWVRIGTPDLDAQVLVKFTERNGRSVVETLVVSGDEIGTAILRAIPMSRIEAMLNQHDIGKRLQKPMRSRWIKSWHDELARVEDGLAQYFEGSSEPSFPPEEPAAEREPLQRPDGADPEAFYRRVAAAYSELIGTTSKPAKVLADEAGVPVTTVHRWIHEARRRGLLPPARKGRAG